MRFSRRGRGRPVLRASFCAPTSAALVGHLQLVLLLLLQPVKSGVETSPNLHRPRPFWVVAWTVLYVRGA